MTTLQQRAEAAAKRFSAARTPVVVEFAGVPKAGKSTTLGQAAVEAVIPVTPVSQSSDTQTRKSAATQHQSAPQSGAASRLHRSDCQPVADRCCRPESTMAPRPSHVATSQKSPPSQGIANSR